MDCKFYVSLKVDELLKEKGCLINSRITKAEAIDWLDSKGIMIDVHWIGFVDARKWNYSIFNCSTYDRIDTMYIYSTRLEAEEEAIIKACELLTNEN